MAQAFPAGNQFTEIEIGRTLPLSFGEKKIQAILAHSYRMHLVHKIITITYL